MFKLNKTIDDKDEKMIDTEIETEKTEVNLFEAEFKEEQTKIEELIVPKNSKILGDLETETDDILISGTLLGNISSKATVRIEGEVIGNISAKVLILNSGRIEGNLTIEDELSSKIETEILGDITAKDAIIDGQVKGNITTIDTIHLQKNSLIDGNLETRQLSVLKGSIFNGQIKTVN